MESNDKISHALTWMHKQGYDRKASQQVAPIIVKYIESTQKENNTLELAQKLLDSIICADKNVIDEYENSDIIIRDLYEQCKLLVEKLK